MAREEELKRVDLKVNVSCCEGCRRKVMKAMSVKGVLRTEIDPNHDRVTVVGDVDAKVLVKKLAKVGKIAEVLAPPASPSEQGTKRDGSGRKDERPAAVEEKSNGAAGDKAAAAAACKQECKKCMRNEKAPSRDAAAKENDGAKPVPPDHSAVAPPPPPQVNYHRAEPAMVVPVHAPYYAPGAPAPYYGYYAAPAIAMPVATAPRQLRPQPSRFDEDFFSDDNTVGCHVM